MHGLIRNVGARLRGRHYIEKRWVDDDMGKHARKQREIIVGEKLSPYFLEIEAAKYLRMDIRTLRRHRAEETGPPFRRHGGVLVYHEKDLDGWSTHNVETI